AAHTGPIVGVGARGSARESEGDDEDGSAGGFHHLSLQTRNSTRLVHGCQTPFCSQQASICSSNAHPPANPESTSVSVLRRLHLCPSMRTPHVAGSHPSSAVREMDHAKMMLPLPHLPITQPGR